MLDLDSLSDSALTQWRIDGSALTVVAHSGLPDGMDFGNRRYVLKFLSEARISLEWAGTASECGNVNVMTFAFTGTVSCRASQDSSVSMPDSETIYVRLTNESMSLTIKGRNPMLGSW